MIDSVYHIKVIFQPVLCKHLSDSQNVLAGFYTKLNVWGSLRLNFDYDGGPIIENGGPIFIYIFFVLVIIKSRYM